MKLWTKPEVDLLLTYALLPPAQVYNLYTASFGAERSYDSIQKKVQQLRSDAVIGAVPAIEPNQNTQPLVGPTRPDVLQWIQQLDEINATVPDYVPVEPNPNELNSTLVLTLSDLHIGKLTSSYSIEEAMSRLSSIPEKIATFEHHNAISDIVVGLIGDIVDGEDIYSNHNTHIECPAIDQVKAATEGLWQLALGLQSRFNVPVSFHTAPGNHGRISKTVHERSNWDNVVYYTLHTIARYSQNRNISVIPGYEEFTIVPIRDQLGLFYHQGVKHIGTPATRERVAGWLATYDMTWLAHGHWHTSNIGEWSDRIVISNGCLCGADDLALRMGKAANAASQWYFKIKDNYPPYGFTKLVW